MTVLSSMSQFSDGWSIFNTKSTILLYCHAVPDVCSAFWITRGQFDQAIVADKCNDIPALQMFIMFGRCLCSGQTKWSSA